MGLTDMTEDTWTRVILKWQLEAEWDNLHICSGTVCLHLHN